jgi:hypothetical protein
LFTFNPNTTYYRFIYGSAGLDEPIVQGPLGEFGDFFPGARVLGGAFFSAAQNLFYVGFGYSETEAYLWSTDMWAYHVANGTWAWVAGSEFVESPGIYGVPGIEGGNLTETYPGGRQEFAEAWDEENQYYYIVGGFGYSADGSSFGLLNDVWRFNAATWKWTFLSGSDALDATPVYGAHNTFDVADGADAAVLPGMRFARAGFDKTEKVMYIYSAYQVNPNGVYVNVNDLWAVRVTDGAVAYLNGTKSTTYNGVYGTRDVAATSNQPGCRYYQQVYFNEKEQALYLLGGRITLDVGRWYNDLWKYDVKTALWTWTGGSNKFNQFPVSQNVRNLPYNYTYTPGSVSDGISWYDEATERYYFGYGAGHSVFGSIFLKPDIWFIYRGFFADDKSAVVAPTTTTTTTTTTAATTATTTAIPTTTASVSETAQVTSTPSSSSSSTGSTSSGTASDSSSETTTSSSQSETATATATSTASLSSNSTTTASASGSTTIRTSTSSAAQTTTKASQTTSRKTTTSASVIPTEDVDLGSFAAPKEQTSVLALIGLVVALMMNA